MSDVPLVSVGIPTFNRLATLRRAVASVLQQDYRGIELIISDNASTDGTQSYCEGIAAINPHIRYLRHEHNRGAVANFRAALANAHGEYFMWLGDDDWIDSNYIHDCVAVLENEPDCSLAGGRGRFVNAGVVVAEAPPLILLQDSGADRVLDYYSNVTHNNVFYGLMRRRQLNAARFTNVIGGDWLIVAAMALSGKVFGVDAIVNRSGSGMSSNRESLIQGVGGSNWLFAHPKLHFISIMMSVFIDILYRNPVYHILPIHRRFLLACRAPLRISDHYGVGISYWIGELRSRLRIRSRARVFWDRLFLKMPGR